MNKVMVDNWFLEDVVNFFLDEKKNTPDSYEELLMAIVLWDEVCYPLNSFNWWNSIPSHIQDRLFPIDDTKHNGVPGIGLQSIDAPINMALHYMALSSNHGCDYLPCFRRRTADDCYRLLDLALLEIHMQRNLDRAVKEYYRETYKILSEFSRFEIKMPILAKYILDNTPEGMTPFDYAFHLRNEGPVIKYKQYLNKVEDALENQNWKDFRYLLRCSEDTIADVLSLDKKSFESVTFNILPVPSISLKFRGVDTSISGAPSFSIKTDGSYRRLHLTFLKDLTTYAINKMRLW